ITLHEEKKRQLERLKSALLKKMFADKSGYPAVRFEGFSDEWKIFKLSSLATMHARIGWQNLRTSEFLSHGKYMLITGTDFNNGQIDFSTCHYVEKERYEQDKHIQIKNGSILITKDGTLGKVAYVQGLSKPATLNAGIFNIEIRNENEIDRTYLFQYLKAPYLMNYVRERATGGTIKHLNQSILKSFPVQMPNKIEQNKIGELITKLDHLINLQRKKLNNIAALKNSLLQSMFI
ncbi:restriction endonuclease subunit S, partial [Lactobacillus delbrueckii]|uniref:restriction endonuclease subunit S n=1 Tax=Lactobacillus delbrueckii TaxID=1584 RepID=UPI003A83A93A